MIVDKKVNIRNYASLMKNLDNGLAAIDALEHQEVGRYEFDGGFFMIQEGDTAPMSEGVFETHRKYIDVQIMLEGSEELAWQDTADLENAVSYDETKDAEFFKGKLDVVIKVTPGMFYAVYPNDGHMPSRHMTEQQHFKKIVMKLPV